MNSKYNNNADRYNTSSQEKKAGKNEEKKTIEYKNGEYEGDTRQGQDQLERRKRK